MESQVEILGSHKAPRPTLPFRAKPPRSGGFSIGAFSIAYSAH